MENDDFDRGTRKSKKRKSKVTLGISLMENFTAKNVGHGRLTVRTHFPKAPPMIDRGDSYRHLVTLVYLARGGRV